MALYLCTQSIHQRAVAQPKMLYMHSYKSDLKVHTSLNLLKFSGATCTPTPFTYSLCVPSASLSPQAVALPSEPWPRRHLHIVLLLEKAFHLMHFHGQIVFCYARGNANLLCDVSRVFLALLLLFLFPLICCFKTSLQTAFASGVSFLTCTILNPFDSASWRAVS